MARPLDPRLLHHARAARGYVVLTAGLGLVTAGLVAAQALLLARIIAGAVSDGERPAALTAPLVWLAAVVAGRATVAWTQERFAHRAATTVVAQLRGQVLAHVGALGPSGLDGDRGPAITTLTTRGLDALDGYLVRYLPQLLTAATVTPALLAVVWWHDSLAGVTILVTLPLVPLFMVLVGRSTQAAADRRLRTLQRLGGQVLDLVAGLPTLRALGRERGQAVLVRRSGDAYRRATMRTLRQAFLSALVLETLTTVSVALVAVGIGLRLVYSELDLRTGLAVLVLAPEVFLPLRMVGVHYHASVDGVAAATAAFAVLDRTAPVPGSRPCPDLRTSVIRLEGVGVRHPGRDRATPSGLDVAVRPGHVVALTGPSGTGKSTAVQVLLGLRRPDAGRVTVTAADGSRHDLADLDPAGWFRQLTWVAQRPLLVPGTLADNLRLAAPGATDPELAAAARAGGLEPVIAALPQGWATRIGSGGHGLSAGQRQRLALARALVRPAAVVVLDEPTAHLDAGTEQLVLDAVRDLRGRGTGVVLVAHRPALLALADEVVQVSDGPDGAITRPDRVGARPDGATAPVGAP
ncbi:MAG TPA: thiol reductant ABC exporter subunit CydD [Kineosporiaceae bacterium]